MNSRFKPENGEVSFIKLWIRSFLLGFVPVIRDYSGVYFTVSYRFAMTAMSLACTSIFRQIFSVRDGKHVSIIAKHKEEIRLVLVSFSIWCFPRGISLFDLQILHSHMTLDVVPKGMAGWMIRPYMFFPMRTICRMPIYTSSYPKGWLTSVC